MPESLRRGWCEVEGWDHVADAMDGQPACRMAIQVALVACVRVHHLYPELCCVSTVDDLLYVRMAFGELLQRMGVLR